MATVIDTLLFQHDLRLVVVAAVVCALSASAGIGLWHHARRERGRRRLLWLSVAAVALGFGVWATHFIAILAFRPDFVFGYDILVTAGSAAISIVVIGIGLGVAASGAARSDLALGGAVIGLGVALMHYVGMAALIHGGRIGWDPGLVSGSVLIGMGLGAASMLVAGWGRHTGWRVGGIGLMTLAICAMHFTGMGAADLSECFPIVSAGDVSAGTLSVAVALASLIILASSFGGLLLDLHERRRDLREAERMRTLADAAVEGLLVVDGHDIITSNASFQALAGIEPGASDDPALERFFAREALADLFARPGQPLEADLRTAGGTVLPVEIIARPVDFGGTARHAIAVRDLSARLRQEQHIRYLAHHDPLTGLANRSAFSRKLENEIARSRRLGQSFALLVLDLDRFKQVNDLFGHAAGDAMLRNAAEALGGVLAEGQVCARLGGDEFALIVPEVGDPARAGLLAEEVLGAFLRCDLGAATGASLSASIGIAVCPDDAETAEDLVVNADTALYRAKRDGRGVYRFFEPEMGAAVKRKRQLEADLRRALAREEFFLVYQPQVSLATGAVTGFETLLRWRHPERGLVSPAEFVPVAEESELILGIGDWVLRRACAEAAGWTNPLSVAVNVSAVQLHSSGFAERLRAILAETGLAAGRLEIEITETALIRDMARAVATLGQIKGLGVRVAMDDFGTGYSSLSNLRAFPFDKIKVDQSFIRSVDRSAQSAAIVRAVLGLGSGLELPVVAEGVERAEELDFLRAETCAEAQGFLLAQPQDIGAFAAITSGETDRLDEDAPTGRATA